MELLKQRCFERKKFSGMKIENKLLLGTQDST